VARVPDLSALTIGIDARAAAEVPAGRGRYLRELLRGLADLDHRHRILLYGRERWDCPELDERFEWRLVPGRDPLWQLPAARAVTHECDVFLATTTYLMVALLRMPSLAVVFDMVPFHGDLGAPTGSLAERGTLHVAVRQARVLLAISEATRNELVERFPRAGSRTRITPLAADARFDTKGEPGERDRLGVERPFVLALGTIEPRKNLERLIQAYVGLPEALRQRFELCLAGATGWKTGPILELAEQHRDSVRRLGYVADEDLPALYRSAELFVYPSLAEGFGLPVLEAMQSGTAVITSNVSSMPEVGGDAARYVNPRDVTDIRTALQELLSDDAKRAELAARGPAQAARFSWHRTAEETLTAIEAAAAT
jgi:glycosyltransferase involved in cell wall biosynthesis